MSVLLAGPAGAISRNCRFRDHRLGVGKTALAATLAMQSDFPLIKIISPESMVGYSEFAKVARIHKVCSFHHSDTVIA